MVPAASSAPDAHRQLARRLVIALALIQLVYQAGLLCKGIEFIAARLPIDDAYYYFQVAWNTPRVGFVTFDGIHRTNGMQFLWAVMLMALSPLASSPIGLLYVCLGLCACLNAICYLPIVRLGEAAGRPLVTAVLAAAWFNINLTHTNWYLSGMENSLHSLVLWCLAACLAGWPSAAQPGRSRAWIQLSILLVLNVWCRLDAAPLSGIIYLALLWKERARVTSRILLTTAAVATSGAAVMLGGFYAMGRYPLPISGLIKSDSHVWSFALFPVLFARGFEFIVPIRFLFPVSLSDRFSTFTVPLIFGVVLVGYAAWVLLRDSTWPSSVRLCWLGLAAGTLAQLMYHSGLGEYATYGIWYQSAYFIFCALTLSIVCQDLFSRVARTGSVPNLARKGLLAAGLLYALFAGGWIYRRWIEQVGPTGFSYIRYHLALWVNRNTGPDDLIAAFNAGELAYFSGRRVVNLDGLVNDYDYYRRIVKGGESLSGYLIDSGVAYVVDYKMPVDVPEGTTLRYSVPDGEGNTYRVLKLPEKKAADSSAHRPPG